MTIFLIIPLFFLFGVVLRYWLKDSSQWVDRLNAFVVHIAFPAVIIRIVPEMDVSGDILFPVVTYWLIIPLMWWFSRFICRLCQWNKDIQHVMFVVCICGNTGFMGVPVIGVLLGNEAIIYALFYDQFGSFIGVSTVVAVTTALYRSQGSPIKPLALLIKVLTFTPFTVLLVSLLLPINILVKPVEQIFYYLSLLIVPASMVSIGLQFSLRLAREYRLPLFIILLVKMLLLPLLALLGMQFADTSVIVTATIVMQVAAAPMVVAAALLTASRIAPALVASTLALGTLISFISLPLWAYLLV